MNRLTRKIKGYYSVDLRTCLPMEYEQIENSNACVDKLGKLEDIEEELGIDLITLLRALKDGINVYYEDIGRYKFRNNLRLEYHKTLGWGLVYIYGCSCRDDMPMKLDKEFYELKGYQKTWFLKEDSCGEESKDE